jgi:lipopolysaccharide export system protein LptA
MRVPRPWMLPLFAAAGMTLVPLAAARAQLGTSDNNNPISIEADSGIEWQQNQQLYIARGNATAIRGPATIKADTLIAHYRQAKAGSSSEGTVGNTEIYRVEADGHVVISRDNRVVTGDHADYDVDQGIGIVRGKDLKITTAADVVTARDTLEWYDQKQIAVARGDAVAVHGNRTIKGDILTAYMVKDPPKGPDGKPAAAKPPAPPKPTPTPAKPGAGPIAGVDSSKINRVDAQGHVVVVSGPDIGRGDYGVYNAVSGICSLLGNVTITRGQDVITGQYAVMDMNNNVSRILPASTLADGTKKRVTGLFVKQDATAADGAKPAGDAAKPPVEGGKKEAAPPKPPAAAKKP